MGNVTTTGGIALPAPLPAVTDYTIAAASNRLTDSLGPKNRTFTHDGAGNITSDGTWSYVYNDNNRLEQVKAAGAVVAQYAYDAFERRVKKVVNGVTTHFHYDLNGLLISETDGNGNPRKDYVYLNGEPVAMKVYGGSAGWYWFINDHLGTPQKMVDAAGNVVWAAAYAPFGEARVYVDEVENNLRFPGQYYDVETGLHYNWHRYYDPETGRYLRPDPIGLEGGMNLYAYVQNNPLNLLDPLGLFSWRSFARGTLKGTVGVAAGFVVGAAIVSTAPASVAVTIGVAAAGVGGFTTGQSIYEGVSGRKWSMSGNGVELCDAARSESIGNAAVGVAAFALAGSRWGRTGAGRDMEWLRMSPRQRLAYDQDLMMLSNRDYGRVAEIPPGSRGLTWRDQGFSTKAISEGLGPASRNAFIYSPAGSGIYRRIGE